MLVTLIRLKIFSTFEIFNAFVRLRQIREIFQGTKHLMFLINLFDICVGLPVDKRFRDSSCL